MRRTPYALPIAALLALTIAGGCEKTEPTGSSKALTESEFDATVKFLRRHADAIVLSGEGDTKIAVSPKLQGRILTAKVGKVESTGFVNQKAIEEGEVHEHFNNFGGIDRFWIGPEAGQFGVYFPVGAELNRDTWQVPASFDTGAFRVVGKTPQQISLKKTGLEMTNYIGTKFRIDVLREVGLIPSSSLATELEVSLPAGVSYIGCYSDNVITNAGDAAWTKEEGMIAIWILGMFAPSPSTVVLAPVKKGDAAQLGPQFNDDYFGKIQEVSPERIALVTSATGNQAVAYRGDSTRIGKFGVSQKRTTGVAGAYDFTRDLLTIVKFSVPEKPELYGNSTWHKVQAEPFGGDTFQCYNNGIADKPDTMATEPFVEIESASPVRPLAKGESIRHRHATFHFQGPRPLLLQLAESILGVNPMVAKAALKI